MNSSRLTTFSSRSHWIIVALVGDLTLAQLEATLRM
jgi:hypothetical protein